MQKIVDALSNVTWPQTFDVQSKQLIDNNNNICLFSYMNIIIPLAVLLVVLIGVLLFRVQSLLSIAKGDDDKPGAGLNKFNGGMFIVFMVSTFGLFIWYTFAKMDAYMLPEAATPHGRETDSMLWSSLIICSVAFLVTNALLFIFAYKYQYKKGKKATFFPDNSIENTFEPTEIALEASSANFEPKSN